MVQKGYQEISKIGTLVGGSILLTFIACIIPSNVGPMMHELPTVGRVFNMSGEVGNARTEIALRNSSIGSHLTERLFKRSTGLN